MARHRATSSIGADPCRNPAGEEIVVCGRRQSPYALPLYDPAGRADTTSGRAREAAVESVQGASAACHARGEACLKPLRILGVGGPSGKIRLITDGK